MFSIGEFSQVTRLTIKTLRFYHDLGILVPVKVDERTGYRYYDDNSCREAFSIMALKELGFSLQEIQVILRECETETDLKGFIEKKLQEVRLKAAALHQLEEKLSAFGRHIDVSLPEEGNDIREVILTLPHIAVLPIRGRYEDISAGFRQLYRKLGRYCTGIPYCFYYDMEYREDDASMDVVVELNCHVQKDGVECRSIEGLRGVRLLHRGPYGSQGTSYMKLFHYCNERGFSPVPPLIEGYIKGPGWIVKGNPQNYITECILLIGDQS